MQGDRLAVFSCFYFLKNSFRFVSEGVGCKDFTGEVAILESTGQAFGQRASKKRAGTRPAQLEAVRSVQVRTDK